MIATDGVLKSYISRMADKPNPTPEDLARAVLSGAGTGGGVNPKLPRKPSLPHVRRTCCAAAGPESPSRRTEGLTRAWTNSPASGTLRPTCKVTERSCRNSSFT